MAPGRTCGRGARSARRQQTQLPGARTHGHRPRRRLAPPRAPIPGAVRPAPMPAARSRLRSVSGSQAPRGAWTAARTRLGPEPRTPAPTAPRCLPHNKGEAGGGAPARKPRARTCGAPEPAVPSPAAAARPPDRDSPPPPSERRGWDAARPAAPAARSAARSTRPPAAPPPAARAAPHVSSEPGAALSSRTRRPPRPRPPGPAPSRPHAADPAHGGPAHAAAAGLIHPH